MSSAVSTDGTRLQWLNLGDHPEACMTAPHTCEAGGAISLWFKRIGCSVNKSRGGVFSTRNDQSSTGITLVCAPKINQ